MRENLRRPLLFLITVGAGTLFITIDATLEVIVAGTVLAGFLALVVTGTLDLADLKPSRLRSALQEKAAKEARQETPKSEKGEATSSDDLSFFQRVAATEIDLTHLPGMLGTFAASVREAITHARAPENEKEEEIRKIDLLLDQTVDGEVPEDPDRSTPSSQKTAGGVIDPLASLEDLEIDFDSLKDLDLDDGTSGPGTAFESDQISLLSEEEADAASEILKAYQDEIDDQESSGDGETGKDDYPADLPVAPSPIDQGLPGADEDLNLDMGLLSKELAALDDLDLDDLDEIEVEGDDEAGIIGEVENDGVGEDQAVAVGEDLEEPEEDLKDDFDIVSFASGGTVDDDLISALKLDVGKKEVFVEDISLVRELKGKTFSAEELAAELEEVLAMLDGIMMPEESK
jgi:hypothetical protein